MKNLLTSLLILGSLSGFAQQQCSLNCGTNLSGLSDYMTEMPLVDVMRHSRTWYTTNASDPAPFNTETINSIPKDANGYPLELPYSVAGTPQIVKTIWADMSAWPEGDYTLLYDGDGDFDYWGNMDFISQTPGRIVLRFNRPVGQSGIFELKLTRSNVANRLRNIRLLMPGTEATYQTQPFYAPFINRLQPFKAIRFMDWGRTNNWGNDEAWFGYDEDADSVRVNWNARAKMTDVTWTSNKGVPYELMIDLCNQLQKDMWICIPHSASNDYIQQMATLVKTRLNPNLRVYVEYSNEIWNWMFGQAQWANKFPSQTTPWPERTVPLIQNAMDQWSMGFAGELNRCTRVVAVQGGWQDVSNRVVFNMRPGSFDAFSPAAYFGLSEQSDSRLDALGASATVTDVAREVRFTQQYSEMQYLRDQKAQIADVLNIPMIYYEGGQHITPTPFGDEPTYGQALIDIQRDTALYNIYQEWFTFLKSLSSPSKPSLLMSFSFVSQRSARYGSWGILESITQDVNAIPAPKYKAILELVSTCPNCLSTTVPVCIPVQIKVRE